MLIISPILGFSFMALIALLRFFLRRKKFILMLIRLEFMLLILFFLFILSLHRSRKPLSYSLVLLVFGACEARLGLRLLISMIRSKGNDMVRINKKF